MIHYPKYVKAAGQWVITEFHDDPKTKKRTQAEHWYSTEAVAIAEYKRLTEIKE